MKSSSLVLVGIVGFGLALGAVFLLRKPWPSSPPPPAPLTALELPVPAPGALPPAPITPPSPPSKQEPAAVTPPAPVNAEAEKLPAAPGVMEADLTAAKKLLANHKLLEARDRLRNLLKTPPPAALFPEIKALLGDVNMTILLSKNPAPEKIEHVVVTGDTLTKIAAQYNIPIALIKKANGLATDTVRLGDHLLLEPAKFSIFVEKSKLTLTLLDSDQFFKTYPVGLGAANSTPVGEFKITSRLAKPTWYREDGKEIPYGDPQNVLGTHWLALDRPHIGIHGTWDEKSIGQNSSHGCVRLLNRDIEELFIILPLNTKVRIAD